MFIYSKDGSQKVNIDTATTKKKEKKMNKKCYIELVPNQGWQIQDANHQTIKVPHPDGDGGYYKHFWDYESARAVALKNGYDPQN